MNRQQEYREPDFSQIVHSSFFEIHKVGIIGISILLQI